jgi:hypothetical protein
LFVVKNSYEHKAKIWHCQKSAGHMVIFTSIIALSPLAKASNTLS